MYTRIIVIRMSGFRSHKESQSVLFLKSPNPYINLFDRDLAVYMSIPYSLRITYNQQSCLGVNLRSAKCQSLDLLEQPKSSLRVGGAQVAVTVEGDHLIVAE